MPELEEGSEGSSANISCRCPSDQWISQPRISRNGTLPLNALDFEYSFGYNSKKLFNLCLIDSETLVFASGNILHFFNIKTKEMSFRRSALGSGIGCITKNPNPQYNYLTVAENGIKPPIILYSYPSLEIVHVLNDGAKRSFTHMDYSRDGELLASQAGDPDYMLTIWEWKKSQIILRAKSFQNDVLNVVFSPYNPTQLTSCGLGHIKFWKMNRTFTGLKLQGELGRFGKTEICDIYAIFPLPDEKVISGCEWGNMLVWDGGLIKLEVCRKNRKPCHAAPITQISMIEGEVMTVGMDGYVRIWFWETVDLADPPEDDRFVEIEPIYEFRIGSKTHLCELRHLVKKEPEYSDDYMFYAQDGAGGIWLCDLNPEKTPMPPVQLYRSHEGAIVAIAPSPISRHVATLDEGGRLHLYDYKSQYLVTRNAYPSGGRDLIWLPPSIEPSGLVVVAGFDDGVLRTILIETAEQKSKQAQRMHLIDVCKVHSKGITRISINPKLTVLATASEDFTVFIQQLQPSSPFVLLVPIGFVTMSSIPTALNWRPIRPSTIVIGCEHGHVAEIDVPDKPRSYTDESFSLDHIQRKEFQFTSVKSEIRRQLEIERINQRKQAKIERKLAELKKMQEQDPSIEKDLAIYLEDSDPEDELEPLFYPKIPNRILWLQYTSENTIWLSLAGYDAGYIYECACESNRVGLIKSTLIADADDIEITAYFKFEYFQIFGLRNGTIRVISEKPNFRDLSDYWELPMHDNFNGRINAIAASFDFRYFFSIGEDGNLFSYKWNLSIPPVTIPQTVRHMAPKKVADIDDRAALSLEEEKLKHVSDSQMQAANERKAKTLDVLSDYKLLFKEIMKRNRSLPASQQFTHDELELDSRITADIVEGLNEQLQLVRRKMAFDVEKATLAREKVVNHFIDPLRNLQVTVAAIRTDKTVSSFRMEKLDDAFYQIKEDVEIMIQERKDKKCDERKASIIKGDIQYIPEELGLDIQAPVQSTESFLQGLTASAIDIKLGSKMRRLLEKYRYRKTQERTRDLERSAIESQRPDPNQNHPDDTRAIQEAKKNIGDYKLKTDPNYEPDERQNTLQKYKEIILAREELFDQQDEYNSKIFSLRSSKHQLYEYIENKLEELSFLHEQLPGAKRKFLDTLPEINMDQEYPEEALKLTTQTGTGVEVRDLFSRKSEVYRGSLLRAEKRQEVRYTRIEWEALGLGSKFDSASFEEVCTQMDELPQVSEEDSSKQAQFDSKTMAYWSNELAFNQTINALSQQDYIIQDIEYRISEFDRELEELSESRLTVETDAKFLDLFLVTLNQELYILRDFERLEDDLVQQVEASVQLRNEMQTNIIRVKNAMEEHRKGIEKMVEQEKTIQNQFMSNIKNNKFADFLRRIFKKKYKPPKEAAAEDSDESSASSDSSSSEEDDTKSIDSLDVAPVRLDENYCPPGCDRNLYDLTFELRAERHVLEQKVYEEHKAIEIGRKQTDELNIKMRAIEVQLTANRGTLMEFRREKQGYLNKVDTVIILKMDQMQYFKEGDNIYDIDSTLLFSMPSVTKLYTRVGQLYDETEEAKQKHRINIVHLSRMKADCKYMDQSMSRLKSEIDQAMIRKFGRVVNLDELEESVLRRFVFNLRINIEDEKRDADKKIAAQKNHLADLEQNLIKETQLGTEKINILTVLQEEKNYLRQILQRQSKVLEKLTSKSDKHVDFRHDLNRLKDIEQQQQEQIEYLEKEIRSLRLRAKTFLCTEEQRKTEPAEYNELLPPQDEICYEEYVYMAVHESAQGKEEHTVSPQIDIFERVNMLTGKFFIKVLGHQAEEIIIRKYATKIAKHMAYVANNLDRTQSINATDCVLKFIRKTIPKQLHVYLKEPDLRNLFHDTICIVQDRHSVVNTNDIIAEVVQNAQEMVNRMQVLNITHELVKEILKGMIEVLPVSEICNENSIRQIAESLSVMEDVDARCINFTQLADCAVQHAKENMNDDITLYVVRRFTDMLSSMLGSKTNTKKQYKEV